ncbi:hypothetical protein BDM02DRAFT_3184644 [Thelephora ganbajun]|uniref:Uncharacterized protein n=1 Tax=Thelephora ganbajun TaxID=370292 RepID=A0ACB6ZP33_THEGA|nr:hypothetical protein BDM02DRAFT_3184644 [Thelephora ganbajun]
MDQTHEQLDPEVAQEVIAILNKKIANLRSENAQLQSQLSRGFVKTEDGAHGSPNDNTRRLLEEFKGRPGSEEVAVLEERLEESKQRRQELEQQLHLLRVKLEESESGTRTAVAIKGALEKEVETLCHAFNERTREKEEAIAQLESPVDMFDFRRFLDGRLVKLPSRHKPTLMTAEEKCRFKDVVVQRGGEFFSAGDPHGIIWADEGGGCVVPLPSVVYNGKSQIAEQLGDKPIANRSYEFCGVDKRNHRRTYHGTYRCVKVTTTDWKHLVFLDQKFAEHFLGRVVIETGFAPPVFVSFIRRLYETGVLKVYCVVLQYERFNGAAVEQVQSTEKSSTIINVPSHRGGKRPNGQHQGRGEGSSKKPRLKN